MQSSPDVASFGRQVRQSRRLAPAQFGGPRDARDHRVSTADLARPDHGAARRQRRRRLSVCSNSASTSKRSGRAGGPGQPILYGTTELFLDRMALASLDDLPPIEEFMPPIETANRLVEEMGFDVDESSEVS